MTIEVLDYVLTVYLGGGGRDGGRGKAKVLRTGCEGGMKIGDDFEKVDGLPANKTGKVEYTNAENSN